MDYNIASALILAAMFIGFAAGWMLRSLLFGWERDCANPEHDDKPQSWE